MSGECPEEKNSQGKAMDPEGGLRHTDRGARSFLMQGMGLCTEGCLTVSLAWSVALFLLGSAAKSGPRHCQMSLGGGPKPPPDGMH